MQTFYFKIKGPEEVEHLKKSYHLFVNTLPVRLRKCITRKNRMIIMTCGNEEFFKLGVYRYLLSVMGKRSDDIHERLTTDALYPTPKDPAMASGHYLPATKNIRSHVFGLPDYWFLKTIDYWIEQDRLKCGVCGTYYMVDCNEFEQYFMERLNKVPRFKEGYTTDIGSVKKKVEELSDE